MVSHQGIIDISSWDGTLSSSDFCIAACSFAEKWKRFNCALPHWSWVLCPKRSWIVPHEVEGYLSLQNVLIPRSIEDDHDKGSYTGKKELSCCDKDEPFDDAILVHSYAQEAHHYDFHVTYSSSYKVPVLYFRAYCSDGQPLMLNDIEKDLPANSAKVLSESKWTFITQQEHPYLNRTWYTLHPCGTSEWMKLLLTNTSNVAKGCMAVDQYMVSWLSVVGQVVGLKIPFEMLCSI